MHLKQTAKRAAIIMAVYAIAASLTGWHASKIEIEVKPGAQVSEQELRDLKTAIVGVAAACWPLYWAIEVAR